MKHDSNKLHFQLPTQDCWSHTWRQPKPFIVECDHHNGERFFNEIRKPEGRSRWDLLRWLVKRKSNTWNVNRDLERLQFQHSPRALPQERPHALLEDWQFWFIGHATVLIKIGPYNILTDPVWAEYVSPKQGKGPQRVCPAGIALEELPTIHAVLLSHNHYDHMDLASLTWLHNKFAMPIYTGLGNAVYLPSSFNVSELDWWQSALFKDLKIVYTPAQHGSGRGFRDQNAALWGGFTISTGEDYCFFAGDTGYSPHFKEIFRRFGAPRAALLPIGAYEPRELMRYMHMNPEDAFQAHLDLQSRKSLAIHYRTFQLTDEPRDEPEQRFNQVIKSYSRLSYPFYCIREGRRLSV